MRRADGGRRPESAVMTGTRDAVQAGTSAASRLASRPMPIETTIQAGERPMGGALRLVSWSSHGVAAAPSQPNHHAASGSEHAEQDGLGDDGPGQVTWRRARAARRPSSRCRPRMRTAKAAAATSAASTMASPPAR